MIRAYKQWRAMTSKQRAETLTSIGLSPDYNHLEWNELPILIAKEIKDMLEPDSYDYSADRKNWGKPIPIRSYKPTAKRAAYMARQQAVAKRQQKTPQP